MQSKIKTITNIVIPYDHEDIDLTCDFIFQTIKQLNERQIKVLVLLRHHFQWFPVWLMHLFFLKYTKKNTHLLLVHTPTLIPRVFEIFTGFTEINRRFSLFVWRRFIEQSQAEVFWNFDPFNIDLLKAIESLQITKLFDCVDYYTSIVPEKKKEIEAAFHDSLSISDIVCANSQTLETFCKQFNKNTYLVPQGFDVETFAQQNLTEVPPWLTKDCRKKIGFFGNLTYRIDFELLKKVISFHQEHLFLISDAYLPCYPEDEVCQTKKKIAELRNHPNIVWVPKCVRKDLIQFMKACDIFIIPYNIQFEFNHNCYPMKVMEYVYLGKPVISTPIQELKRFPKFVKIGSNMHEWKKNIKVLIEKPWPKSYKREQRKFAEENSWDNKISSILNSIH